MRSSTRMSRRSLLWMSGTATIALLAAACVSPPAEPRAATPQSAPTPAPAAAAATGDALSRWEAELPRGDVTVSFWHGTDATANKLYTETFIAGYKKLRPNYTIQEEAVPSPDQKLVVALATDTAPDLFTTNTGTIQTFMAKNALAAVPPAAWGAATTDELLSRHFLPNVMRVVMKDGALYGIPIQMNAYSLMVNTRLFTEAGLDPAADAPKTWDGVARLNSILTKRDAAGRITRKGFEFLWARPDQISTALQQLIRQAGGEILEDGVRPLFNSDLGVKAMQTLKDISVDPKVTQTSPTSPLQDFATEQNAMHMFGPNGGSLVEYINPKMKGSYIFTRLPQMQPDKPFATIIAFSLAVNARASEEKRRVAHDFIQYVGRQPEVWLEATGQLTPLASLRTSPRAREIMPFLEVAIQDLIIAQPSTRTDFTPQLDAVLKAAAERVVYEGQGPKASLDQAAEEFTKAIAR